MEARHLGNHKGVAGKLRAHPHPASSSLMFILGPLMDLSPQIQVLTYPALGTGCSNSGYWS